MGEILLTLLMEYGWTALVFIVLGLCGVVWVIYSGLASHELGCEKGNERVEGRLDRLEQTAVRIETNQEHIREDIGELKELMRDGSKGCAAGSKARKKRTVRGRGTKAARRRKN